MTTKRADRPRSGQSDVLAGSRTGDPRSRHANAAPLSDGDVAPPLSVRDGKVTLALDPQGPIQKSVQGTVVLNLGPGFEVVKGSPPRLQARLSDSVVADQDGRLRARVHASEVRGFQGAVLAVATPVAQEKAAAALASLVASVPMGRFLSDDGTFRPLLSPESDQGVGYRTGAGGSVAQAGSKSTAVTLDKLSGKITMDGAALASLTAVQFTVNCAPCLAADTPVVAIRSGGTAASYLVSASAVAAGSFAITVFNCSGGPLSEALVLNFAIVRGAEA